MSVYPPALERLIAALARLPSIGPKMAVRLALYLLRAPKGLALDLAESLTEARENIRPCPECFNLTDQELCPICSSEERDKGLICVVEGPAEVAAMERAEAFGGVYHVLGGLLAPLDKVGPANLRIDELLERVRSGGVREVILGLSSTAQGRATAAFIAETLAGEPLKISRLAFGLPLGADIEFADPQTLKASLEGRRS